MALPQMSALGGGRGFKRPYVEEINERKRFLPQMYANKQNEQYRKQQLGLGQRRLGLDRERLAQEKQFGLANLDLAEESAKEARKRNKYAQNLGLANIGLGAGFGMYDAMGSPSFSDIGDWFSPSSDFSGDLMNIGGAAFASGGGGEDFFSSGSGGLMGDILEDWVW